MKILIVLVGVTVRVAIASEGSHQSEQPIPEAQATGLENEGKRQLETPEVVLQLKYDEGELKRIYVTQFRKPGMVWSPSVGDRATLCADLCHAGLGGRACGSSCDQFVPMGLYSALSNTTEDPEHSEHASEAEHASDEVYGQPRVEVCPTLCDNNLGEPLCQCPKQNKKHKHNVDWEAICKVFCSEGYTLGGCPACEAPSSALPSSELMMMGHRSLGTVQGWAAWCDVQCRQGHGGAACNCDRTPF